MRIEFATSHHEEVTGAKVDLLTTVSSKLSGFLAVSRHNRYL